MIGQRKHAFGEKVWGDEMKTQECENKMEQVKSENEVVEWVTTSQA